MRIEPWTGDLAVASDVLTRGFSDYAVPVSESPQDVQRQLDDQYFRPETSRIAWVDGRAVGGVFAVRRDDGRGRIAAMAVDPGYRRRGLGRALLAALPDLGRAHLEVLRHNRGAIALYEAAGFRRKRGLVCLRTDTNEWGPGTGPGEIPASYRDEDVPLHRDAHALERMRGVSVASDRRFAWAAWRGGVLLAAGGWSAETLPALLMANAARTVKIIDVPEGDPLIEALIRLGWREYARQDEMVR